MPIKIGVVGAGQMGAGIAQAMAISGFNCVVTDSSPDVLKRALENVQNSLQKLSAKGLVKDQAEVLRRIFWGPMEDLAQCDLVIEAVVENEDVKKSVISALDRLLKPQAIIASNTSSISITRLSEVTKRPSQFIGMHFMNPVVLMNLVEIIRGAKTSDETLNIVLNLVKSLGKVSTVSADTPGFIANRILMPMINEAFFALMDKVASAKDIDQTMKLGCNMPMGPLALADLIGLDTCLAIMDVLHRGLGAKYIPCPLLKKYVDDGLLGRKTKAGVYHY